MALSIFPGDLSYHLALLLLKPDGSYFGPEVAPRGEDSKARPTNRTVLEPWSPNRPQANLQ